MQEFHISPFLNVFFLHMFYCIIVLQSKVQNSQKYKNKEKICPILSKGIRTLFLGENQYIDWFYNHFPEMLEYLLLLEKIVNLLFNVSLFFNPRDNVLIIVEISCSQNFFEFILTNEQKLC